MTDRGARRWRASQAALLALGISGGGCNSHSTPSAAALTRSDSQGAGGGTADDGSARSRAAGVSEATSGAGAGPVGVDPEGVGAVDLGAVDLGSESVEPGAESGPVDAGVGQSGESDAGGGGELAPLDRIVLFDGADLDEWRPQGGNGAAGWELPGDGTMVVRPGSGSIATRKTFEDLFVHVEYETPALPANVTGQARGNSGVYLDSRYEIQILDSFGLPPAVDGCGAIYQLSAPRSTACYRQEVWNTYEIEFQAARWDARGNKQANARVLSAYLNGVLVQEGVDIPNSTGLGEPEAPGPRPLVLQDHGDRVAFRNIWVVPR